MALCQKFKRLVGIIGVIVLWGTVAHATSLTFEGTICNDGSGDGKACNNSFAISQTYGDIAGQLDVHYADTTSSTTPLQWWSTGYQGLDKIAFANSGSPAEIALIPATGFQVTLNSFDLGSWQNVQRTSQYTIYDSSHAPLLDSVPITVGGPPANTFSHYVFGLTDAQGLIIQWGPDARNVGIDNVDFTVQAISTAVPEPSTILLIGTGLLIMGWTVWRRERTHPS